MLAGVALLLAACTSSRDSASVINEAVRQQTPSVRSPVVRQLIRGAIEQTAYTRHYDPAYVQIAYPGGDVPRETGVCTDVIVRAFRKAGIDLQKEIHEDMSQSFSAYPRNWGLKRPDANIDHRRVPNQMTYFERQGKALSMSKNKADYLPGDVVAWDLGNGNLHMGIVIDTVSTRTGNRLIVHNIGAGARIEDVLFTWEIIGHYRYFQ